MKPDEEQSYISPYDPEPKVLYTFSKLDHFDSIVKGKLWFSPTVKYNDVHENTIFARPGSSSYNHSNALLGEKNESLAGYSSCKMFHKRPQKHSDVVTLC